MPPNFVIININSIPSFFNKINHFISFFWLSERKEIIELLETVVNAPNSTESIHSNTTEATENLKTNNLSVTTKALSVQTTIFIAITCGE